MKIERVWAMPSHKTFSIKPIANLLKEELEGNFIDPFPFPFDKDALTYLKSIPTDSITSLAFDPPYSPRQLKEMYSNAGMAYDTKCSYWSELKDEIARITKSGGKVISFGWNSMGIGKNRGFAIIRVLLVPHGGNHNDTICTVEIKQ
jgi:hypothetical protein